ncbi:unnamed protein product [Rotaria sordida]|uniref:Uncharacterized protein n=1 Tax=Rotaria sordida TaxID=392033 RepID=A0A819GPT2_9BILA|nr:unnamed protein product [Rotaria sordida]CAF3885023.1 unnamed protein product [Rotaria sordida]
MMNNLTTEMSLTTNIFRRYLLGESLKSILIRLTVILSAIIVVWSGIMVALIIHMKCQRSKQMIKTSIPHHHLYDSSLSLTRKVSTRSKRNRRFDSSSLSTCCYSICHFLSQIKQHCIFCSSSSSIDNENSKNRLSPITKRKQRIESISVNSCSNSHNVQIVVEAMTKRSLNRNHNAANIGKKISLYRETDSSSGDELKIFHPFDNNQKHPIKINSNASNFVQLIEPKDYIHCPSISLPKNGNTNDYQTTTHVQKLHKYNTKVTLALNPHTRRLSNTNINSHCLLTSTIPKQQQEQPQRKSLLVISSTLEPRFDNDRKRSHSLLDDPTTTTTEGSITSSSKHIPLVMITDTSSSNTNIVELETFEDKKRSVDDIERRLSQELRATYQPRHST